MIIAYLRISISREHLENQQGEITHYTHDKESAVDRWVTEISSASTTV